MFVRKKKNKSGSVSVQIIDKSDGYKVVETVGSSVNPIEIKKLVGRAWDIINGCQPKLFSFATKEELAIKNFFNHFRLKAKDLILLYEYNY